MTSIPSHFWLEILDAGREARDSRGTRLDDRELLAALGNRPLRVLDVFRRLRWTDSRLFQEALARGVARGWLRSLEEEPGSPGRPGEPSEASMEEDEDALARLVARHAAQADSRGEEATDLLPEGTDLDLSDPEAGWPLPDALASGEPSQEGGADARMHDEERPWEKIPPSPPPSRADADSLLEAMRLPRALLDAPPEEPPAQEAPVPRELADDTLLRLLRGAPDQAPATGAVVPVPEYGMAPPAPARPAQDEGFVRLRDVGAVRGPGDGPAPAGVSSGKEAGGEPGPMTARSRGRLEDRQRMLAAARREAAARAQARERARQRQQEIEARAQEVEDARKQHRLQEEANRGASFLGRAERARRLRAKLDLAGEPGSAPGGGSDDGDAASGGRKKDS